MTRSRSLQALGILAIVLAVWVGSLFSTRRNETVVPGPLGSEFTEVEESAALPVPVSIASVEDAKPTEPPARRAAVETRNDATAAEERTAPDKETITVRGSIVVLDADDVEHRNEQGSFMPLFFNDSTGKGRTAVEVVDGAFELEMPPRAKLGISGLTLGGRSASLDEHEPLGVVLGDELVLRAKWPRRTHLRIVDIDSGIDLDAIELVRCSSWVADDNEHPGDFAAADVVRSGARSPLDLTREECTGDNHSMFGNESVVLWARATGYAWGRIQLDLNAGGERTLVLEPAAELLLTLQNYDPDGTDMEQILRLRAHAGLEPEPEFDLDEILRQYEEMPADQFPDGERPSAEELTAMIQRSVENPLHGTPLLEQRLGAEGDVFLSGLAPGEIDVSVEIGDWFSDSRVLLGWTTVTLQAGRQTVVTLELDALPTYAPAVPLAGTLFVPASWGATHVGFTLEPMDLPDSGYEDWIHVRRSDLEAVSATEGLYLWSADEVIPGRYEVSMDEFQYQQVLRVPEEGLLTAHIEVGERAAVVVHVVDSISGAPAPVERVNWTCERPSGVNGGGLGAAEYDDALGVHRFQAPEGRVLVHIWDDAYGFFNRIYEIHAGDNEITVSLELSCGLVLSVQEGDQPVPYDVIEDHVHIEELEGQGRAHTWGSRKGHARIGVSKPGLYEIRIDPLDGYEEKEPELVQVPPGEWVEHVVALRRIR